MKTNEPSGKSKKIIGSAIAALVIGVGGVFAYSALNTSEASSDDAEIETTLYSANYYVPVNDYTEMSEYDIKKVQEYMRENGGELPFELTPGKNLTSKVTYEQAMTSENQKLGDAPEKEFWF
jgi:hypothetical protein